jgi:hypothetical protein
MMFAKSLIVSWLAFFDVGNHTALATPVEVSYAGGSEGSAKVSQFVYNQSTELFPLGGDLNLVLN